MKGPFLKLFCDRCESEYPELIKFPMGLDGWKVEDDDISWIIHREYKWGIYDTLDNDGLDALLVLCLDCSRKEGI